MNTFLEALFWEQARPFMQHKKDPLEAFTLGMRFAFLLLFSITDQKSL